MEYVELSPQESDVNESCGNCMGEGCEECQGESYHENTKKDCSKCKGEGCDHCDGKGYHEGVNEKKGKDLDKDGDVDGDDYKHAKDKAIKKAMGKDDKKNEQLKEAIKSIIKKTLNSEAINEAATKDLAKIADDYQGYKGMQVVMNDLQNIVTDIESYYAKQRDRLQGVFDKIGQVENEEGLKVGGFLAPAIEAAFKRDLRPVARKGFMDGVDIPKVQMMPKEMEAPQQEVEGVPKQTIFGINEKKK